MRSPAKTEVEERLWAFMCAKDIISLKAEPATDLDRINLTNGHDQKLSFAAEERILIGNPLALTSGPVLQVF